LLTGAPSAFSNRPLRNLLRRILPVLSFSELRIPLAVVTTDLETGETIVLTEGDLIEAILASTALPGLFPPIAWRGRRLVDGGLSNNVPIDLAIERGAGRVIGMLCGCAKGLPARRTSSLCWDNPFRWPSTRVTAATHACISRRHNSISWNLA